MPVYRMYSLDDFGRIGFAHEIDAPTDQEAIVMARSMKPNATKGEIWEGRRLVAAVSAHDWESDPA